MEQLHISKVCTTSSSLSLVSTKRFAIFFQNSMKLNVCFLLFILSVPLRVRRSFRVLIRCLKLTLQYSLVYTYMTIMCGLRSSSCMQAGEHVQLPVAGNTLRAGADMAKTTEKRSHTVARVCSTKQGYRVLALAWATSARKTRHQLRGSTEHLQGLHRVVCQTRKHEDFVKCDYVSRSMKDESRHSTPHRQPILKWFHWRQCLC